MNTAFALMAQYNTTVIPIETVCRDYFSHLTPKKFAEKVSRGDIALPMTRIEDSKRAAKGVHISHLARWIDDRMMTAEKESEQLRKSRGTLSSTSEAIGSA